VQQPEGMAWLSAFKGGSLASSLELLRSTIWLRTIIHLHQRAGSLSLSP